MTDKKTEEKEEKKEEKKPGRYTVVKVPTEHTLAFADSKDEGVVDQLELLARIANDVEKIKKGVC